MQGIIIAILAFGLLIFIHELGHYIAAKLCGINIQEFAIGMGPKLFGIKKGETLYSIRILPFGGYLKIEGEDKSSDSISSRSFRNKPKWQRLTVALAGSFMNIMLGFIIVIYLVSSSDSMPSMEISGFMDKSISNNYGLKKGDKILKIGGYSVNTKKDFWHIMISVPVDKTDVLVARDGKKVNIKDVKFPVIKDNQNNVIGIMIDFEIGRKEKDIGSVIEYSFQNIIGDAKLILVSLSKLITGQYGIKSFGGPIQVTKSMGEFYQFGLKSLLSFIAFITVNLGFMNLLPLPALDGGKVVFIFIEIIKGKPVNPKYEGYIHLVGLILFMMLSIIVTYNDIIKIFFK